MAVVKRKHHGRFSYKLAILYLLLKSFTNMTPIAERFIARFAVAAKMIVPRLQCLAASIGGQAFSFDFISLFPAARSPLFITLNFFSI